MQTEQSPLISICIPTYNGETYLQECLESVSQQTYRGFEVIISDNLSKDKTLAIVEDWKSKQPFPVYIYSNPNLGIGKNWNYSIQNAKGDYIKLLFQDDLLKPDCLEKMLEVSEKYPKAGLIACKREILYDHTNERFSDWMKSCGDLQSQFDWEGKPELVISNTFFRHPAFYKSPYNKIGEPTCTLIRKNVFQKIGYFDETYKQILDYEFYNRLLKKHTIVVLDEKLVTFRRHEEQATEKNLQTTNSEIHKYMKETIPSEFFLYFSHRKKISIIKNQLKKLLKLK